MSGRMSAGIPTTGRLLLVKNTNNGARRSAKEHYASSPDGTYPVSHPVLHCYHFRMETFIKAG
jgi:hypothetical protein